MLIPDEKKTLDFKAKAPVSIFLDDDRADYKPGCSVLDISFAEPVTIGEVRFRNNYTAFISICCKKVAAEKDVKNRDMLPWQASVKRFMLMPDPDCETNSQDIFSIPSKESSVSWCGVVNLRIVLKQPSFRWKRFGLEELTFFGDSTVKDLKPVSLSRPTSAAQKAESKTNVSENDKANSTMSPKARYMWTISELMRDTTGAAVGRFETVDANVSEEDEDSGE